MEIVEWTAQVEVGGRYRYLLRRGDDQFGFSGRYTEISPPRRLVYTQVFEAFPGAEAIITVTFEDRDGHTFMSSHELYPSPEARDGALASGMEDGMRETLDQLDDLVRTLV